MEKELDPELKAIFDDVYESEYRRVADELVTKTKTPDQKEFIDDNIQHIRDLIAKTINSLEERLGKDA